jgi:hypothetical protein
MALRSYVLLLAIAPLLAAEGTPAKPEASE